MSKEKTFLGQQIKTARKAMGLTQEELAYKVGISRANLSDLETGRNKKGSILALYDIARVTGKPIEFFISPERTGEENFKMLNEAITLGLRNSYISLDGHIEECFKNYIIHILEKEIQARLKSQCIK